ncbi:MAG: DNA repair protein RadC [Clostridium tyrobutyricum]|jgi:DNA repair protein RadC|uniref:RadC family protein n=1 Tax=Clostridium tyrobutyricum TaxID=1519 RepID=UPI0024332016|nr:DNA repair protein RadC [Clostridium tyrobutyricum]MCH4198785.1 DNA repair protein RadC [Clostridium tyrobutyricum]MCH4259581.1 DNA repair protein RadC [Clostridium tyrobutyricum]MCI1240055.1 DNA repair protein RadC [Clostridium tyrobutyricum]MCI1651255.1 DNA repair protein RadC [Clostridium tyrobutyricum]MCI1938384.1 DNA repair protein RadC [Clostridium tyrobutyricum]
MNRIKDLPENERPRERLFRYGPEALSNIELLAILLGCGSKKENIISLSSRIIQNNGGINGVFDSTLEDFTNISGIGKAKAAKLLAVIELSKRFKSFKDGDNYKIHNSQDAAMLVMKEMKSLKQEHLVVIMLNTKNVVISVKNVFIGSLNSSIVHPREVFSYAIKKSSASIIICHNHPSGDPSPSDEDIKVTYRLEKCGEILGIHLIDHLIIGNGQYISLKEKGIL